MYELIIVGGGPAGMTAAVYAARKKLNTLLISKDIGGQPLTTSAVENYMGYQFIEGPELMAKFEEQVRQFPIDVQSGREVRRVCPVDGGFDVEVGGGEHYRAKAVIVATGKRPRELAVPGEERLRGRGVSYCAVCDGPLFARKRVAVVGGGNSALEAANDLVRLAEHVYLISLTPLTGDQVLIDRLEGVPNISFFLEHEVLEIVGQNVVEALTIRDLKTGAQRRLEVAGVFVEIGLVPNSDLLRGVAQINKEGEVVVNCLNETGIPGLYAAGDVTNVPEKQIVVAAGEGAKAALQAHRYLQRLR